MPKFDFSVLYDKYPEVISQMPPIFDSHQFILKLAHQNQVEYVIALYAYRDSAHIDSPSPFQFVHQRLSTKLYDFPELVALIRTSKPSKDIFGQNSGCDEWRKVA